MRVQNACQEVQSKLWEAGNDAGLQLKKLDKKGEKAMVQNFRLKLQDSLRKETSPAEVLATAVPILFAKVPLPLATDHDLIL